MAFSDELGSWFATFLVKQDFNYTGDTSSGTKSLISRAGVKSFLDAKAANTITVTGTGLLAGGGDLTANRTITLASTAAYTVLMNNTSTTAVPTAVTVANLKTALNITKTDVGLSNVPNVDATARSNHTGTQSYTTITGLAASATTDTTNASNIGSGTLAVARTPAYSGGNVTKSAGSGVLTITTGAVGAAELAQMAANTLKGNNNGSTGYAMDLTTSQVKTMLNVTKSDVGLSNVPNTDATNRANHTGTQAISTIVDLQSTLDSKLGSTNATYYLQNGSQYGSMGITSGTVFVRGDGSSGYYSAQMSLGGSNQNVMFYISSSTGSAPSIDSFGFNATSSASGTNIYLRHNNSFKQVLAGDADSGGSGYRLLRVTN